MQRLRRPTLCAVPLLVTLVGCGTSTDDIGLGGVSATTGTTIGTTTEGATTINATRGLTDANSDDESTEEPPINFIQDPDGGGPSFECDIWTQDCPAGHKCNLHSNDGGTAWNATKCVEVVSNPATAGEPCTWEGTWPSGIDTCDVRGLCLPTGIDMTTGVCREFCMGEKSNPICTDPQLRCGGNRDFPLCLPTCCPLEQDCPEGEACYAVDQDFECALDASGDAGSFGDSCEFLNVCDPGLLCLDSAFVPDCESSVGCCTPFCGLRSSACSDLDATMDCVAWFEEGEGPAGSEHIGACMVTK